MLCSGNSILPFPLSLLADTGVSHSLSSSAANYAKNKEFVKLRIHDDVIKWKHFPRYWPFVRGIHRSTVNSPHKDQWRGALMFSLICARINGWVNNGEAGDLRRYRAQYDVIVMQYKERECGGRCGFNKNDQWMDLRPWCIYNFCSASRRLLLLL